MLTFKQKQTGVGLLELVLALVIIAVILMTSARYFQTARDANRTNQALDMVTAVYTAASTWISQGLDFADPWAPNEPNSDDLLEKFVKTNLLPQGYLNKKNPWGGAFTATHRAPDKIMLVTFTELPETACLDLRDKVKLRMLANSQSIDAECKRQDGELNLIFNFSDTKPPK